jgi:hypothetical protein
MEGSVLDIAIEPSRSFEPSADPPGDPLDERLRLPFAPGARRRGNRSNIFPAPSDFQAAESKLLGRHCNTMRKR